MRAPIPTSSVPRARYTHATRTRPALVEHIRAARHRRRSKRQPGLSIRPERDQRRYMLLITNGGPDCGASQSSGCGDAQSWIGDSPARDGRAARSWSRPGQSIRRRLPDAAWPSQERARRRDALLLRRSEPGRSVRHDRRASCMRSRQDACHLDVASTPIQNADNATRLLEEHRDPPQRALTAGSWPEQGCEIVLHGEWCDRLIEDGEADFARVRASAIPPRSERATRHQHRFQSFCPGRSSPK